MDLDKLQSHYERGIYNLILEVKALGNVDLYQVRMIVDALEHIRDTQCCDDRTCKAHKLAQLGMLVAGDPRFDKLIRDTINRVFSDMNTELIGIISNG